MKESIRRHCGKPILLVLLKRGKVYDYPLNVSGYRESYFDFFEIAEQHFAVFVVRGASCYRGEGTFARGYHYEGGKLRRWQKKIVARVIFDKNMEHSLPRQGKHEWIIVNDPQLSRILKHKDRTYAQFRRFMKAMYRVENKDEFIRALPRISGSIAVFKPLDQYGGEGVVIAPKSQLTRRIRSYNGVVSEYIDTSHGIPGLTRAYHDLRVVLMDGKIVESYIRVPKSGSLISNFARGGTCHYFPLLKIPQRVRTIAHKIDWQLRGYGHRLYSIDFGFEGRKPYVIELNGRPGLPFKQDGIANYRRWHRSLLALLRKAAKGGNK